MILPISASQVVEIIGLYYHTQSYRTLLNEMDFVRNITKPKKD
jgi:hypothetical protein